MPRRPGPRAGAAFVLSALCLIAPDVRLGAAERVFHLLDQRDGLPAGEVVRMAQDSRGFIWMGSFGGLARYDGDEIRPWAPERLNGHVSVLIASPRGDVVVRVEPGRVGDIDPTTLYRVVPGGVEPVAGPDGRPLTGVSRATFGDDGQLCAIQGPEVVCRLASGAWVRHAFEEQGHEEARSVHRGAAESVLVVTDVGVWQLDTTGGRRKIAAVRDLVSVVPHPDGSLYGTLSDPGTIVRIAGGVGTTVFSRSGRAIDLTVRGQAVWASFDRFVVALRPGEPPEVIGSDAGLPSGGPMLVDREGSLWLGTFSGIMLMPEPDTVVWTERDGLPSRHTRFLQRHRDTIWVGTWQGLGRLRLAGGHWEVGPTVGPAADRICLDGGGRLWIANVGDGLVRHEPSGRVRYPRPELHSWLGCGARADGTLWLSTSAGIFVTFLDDRAPRRVAANPDDPPDAVSFRHILQDGRGRLWVAANAQICQAQASAVLGGAAPAWQCREIAGSRLISALVELPDGDLWIATDRAGVWRYEEADGSWAQLPGSRSLPSFSLRGLVRSTDGSIWVLGHGVVARVADDHATPDGWTVVERVTALQGLPSAAAEHILEMPNGSLWITTIVGLVQVPAAARQQALEPPAVELVDVIVNGRRVDEVPADWRLAYSDTVELRFAAMSYRDRGLLRLQYRMRPDDDWVDGPARAAAFRFPDLVAGSYSVEVRTSLDGEQWTARPASVSFEILPPWYRRSWAIVPFMLALGGLLYAVYRVRLAIFLRLERQRTRIAMDLHDEIGSGLGSIHILAGLAAERTPAAAPSGALVSRISDTAAELGASLGEIVWSLRSRSTSLDSLVAHLTERAAKLFPGNRPALHLAIPESLPPVTLSLSVRLNVALIVIEALHNAARHAGATEVELGLAPSGRRWRLWVADNGRGLADGTAGVGIENMRRRAAEIGSDLGMTPNANGGLTVSIDFDPAFHASSHHRGMVGGGPAA